MPKKTILVAIVLVVISVSAAHATVMEVFDLSRSFNTANLGSIQAYTLSFLCDNPIDLASAGSLNATTQLQPYAPFVEMLQRTFRYDPSEREGEMPMAECIWCYENNFLWGYLGVIGTEEGSQQMWQMFQIPDLSGFRINSMYAENITTSYGSLADVTVTVFADVTPVPEPSSVLMLVLGIIGLAFRKALRGRATV